MNTTTTGSSDFITVFILTLRWTSYKDKHTHLHLHWTHTIRANILYTCRMNGLVKHDFTSTGSLACLVNSLINIIAM